MSENVPEAELNEVSQEEVSFAESQEQSELVSAQNTYLKRRVVVLRIQNNRLQAENEQLKAEVKALKSNLPIKDDEEVVSDMEEEFERAADD